MNKTPTFSFEWHNTDDNEVYEVDLTDEDPPPFETFNDIINFLRIHEDHHTIVDQTDVKLIIKENDECQQDRLMIITKS